MSNPKTTTTTTSVTHNHYIYAECPECQRLRALLRECRDPCRAGVRDLDLLTKIDAVLR